MRFASVATTTIALVVAVAGSVGCSPTSESPGSWIRDGIITIARPLPLEAGRKINGSPSSLLGFVPVPGVQGGAWLSISTSEGAINLMNGSSVAASVQGEGIKELRPGTYKVVHKQRAPLWYAPDNYFSVRQLAVPAEGEKSRYLRGALGDFVLFLNKDTPIHSGPIWSDEIGGIRLNEGDISRLYYQLEVGAPVEIR